MDYRLAFDDVDWEPALGGTARLKRIVNDGKGFRMVELTPKTVHAHWCEIGHIGMIVEGDLEIDFDGDKINMHAGDAISIPDGVKDRHRPRAISDRVVMFLIEDEA